MYRKKRWLVMLLIVSMILSVVPQSFSGNVRKAQAQQNDEVSALSEDTTDTNGYKPIYDIGDLYEIRNDLSANYILMNDIDMSVDTAEGGDYDRGNGWEPIQNFTGNFNGNGHRIIGMHIFGDMNRKDVGLFGSAKGSVTNLGIVDCDINVSNTQYAGALVGYVGYNSNRAYSYTKCYITGNIQVQTSGEDYVGGMIGYMDSYKTSYVVGQCYANCNVQVQTSGKDCAGGMIGYAYDSRYLQMNSVYFAGNVGQNYAFVGGGYYEDKDLYTSCYYLENSAKQGSYYYDDDSYGIVKLTASQMKNYRFFTGFDFAQGWEIDPYCVSYLYPQLRCNRQVKAQQVTITKMPETLEYEQGDTADFTDGEIEVIYENKAKQALPITMDMISGADTSKVGQQTVTVSYAGGSAQFNIEVKGVEVEDLTLNKVRVDVNALDTYQLQATIAPANASNKELIWESSDPDVATVTETGLVQGLTKGTATITVYSHDKAKSASCVVNVLVPCVELTFAEEKVQINQGETYVLETKMKPLQSTDKITWTCRKTSVATVDQKGRVTGVGPGTAQIIATADSGVTASCEVEVKLPAAGIEMSDSHLDIKVGMSAKLSAKLYPEGCTDSLLWSSQDTEIAEVDQYGNVKAVAEGTTTIVVTSSSGATTSCEVEVTVPCTELILSAEQIQIEQGDTYKMSTKMLPEHAKDQITWSCEETDVATVDQDGKITAIGPGVAYVTAKADSGVTATCQVNVTLSCTALSITSTKLNMWVTQSTKLVAIMTPSNSTDQLTWTSDNQNVAQVDQYGNVRAVGEGDATITVTSASGVSATCAVNVIKKTIVRLNMLEMNLAVSSSKQLVATLTPATSGETLTWSSSDEKVVKVDQRGLVKAVGAGIARITVKTSSGESDFCIVTVVGTSQGNSSNNTVKKPANNGNTVKIVRMATKIKSVKQIKKTSALVKFSNYKKGQYFEITIKQNGKKATKKIITARSSYRIKKLKSKKRYTISVRSYSVVKGKKYYGKRSAKKKFKTK